MIALLTVTLGVWILALILHSVRPRRRRCDVSWLRNVNQ